MKIGTQCISPALNNRPLFQIPFAKERTMSPFRRSRLVLARGVRSVICATIMAMFAVPAGAAMIDIDNESFESQALADGSFSFAITDWTPFTGGTAGVVVFDPTSDWFTTAGGTGTPTGGDGQNVISANATAVGAYAGILQLTDATLSAGNTYTLTVAVGDFANRDPVNFRLAINTQSMPLGSYLAIYTGLNSELTNDALIDFSVSLTGTNDGTVNVYNGAGTISGSMTNPLGENLRIFLWAQNGTSSSDTHVAFDDVRFEVVPEPPTILLCAALLGIGAGWRGFALARRRKHGA